MPSQFLLLKPEDLVFFHLEGKLSKCPNFTCELRKNGLCWNSDCYEMQVCSKTESYIIWKSCRKAIRWIINRTLNGDTLKETKAI